MPSVERDFAAARLTCVKTPPHGKGDSPPTMQARDVMTTWVATIGADSGVREAARTMLERRVSALPVLDESDRLIGMVSEGDLVRALARGRA